MRKVEQQVAKFARCIHFVSPFRRRHSAIFWNKKWYDFKLSQSLFDTYRHAQTFSQKRWNLNPEKSAKRSFYNPFQMSLHQHPGLSLGNAETATERRLCTPASYNSSWQFCKEMWSQVLEMKIHLLDRIFYWPWSK